MEQVLGTFGIDWKLLLINAANFGLLMVVLWYFLYEPLTRMLEERRERIAQGVMDAQKAQETLTEIETSRAQTLAKAGKEADELLLRARESAQEKQDELIAAGESSAQQLLSDASKAAQELKSQALEESKKEVAKLIVLGMEKAFNQKS